MLFEVLDLLMEVVGSVEIAVVAVAAAVVVVVVECVVVV